MKPRPVQYCKKLFRRDQIIQIVFPLFACNLSMPQLDQRAERMIKRKRSSDPGQAVEKGAVGNIELSTLEGGDKKPKEYKNFSKTMEVPQWKLSEPIGGRMINVDPVFSVDEK
jgi:hypothetical protein